MNNPPTTFLANPIMPASKPRSANSFRATLSLALVLLLTPASIAEETHIINGCVVGLVTKIDLAAPEAGILTHVTVRRGSSFSAEDVIAEIDSREAQQGYKRALAEYELAVKRSEDDIELRYADAQELVEQADYLADLEANAKLSDAVPAAELRKSKLEWDRARLGGEKARKDKILSLGDVRIKKAELDAAEIAIEKRQVRPRFDGEVLKLRREEGEWVQPGDTIAEIARLDTLQVNGYVYFDEHEPKALENCRVTVDVEVARGRVVPLTGYIVYIDPVAVFETKPKYLIRAEITNRVEDGRWLISPNLPARMTIHLGDKNTDIGRRPTRGGSAR